MATTTNYSWNTPNDTDYVKDGALAIRTLGSNADSTLFTALGGNYPGLRLVKKQTIGSAVSSISVSDAFSSTYENYKIIISGNGGGSGNGAFRMSLNGITTNYYNSYVRVNYDGNILGLGNNAVLASWIEVGSFSTTSISMNCDLLNPFLAKPTRMSAMYSDVNYGFSNNGYNSNSTSATGFSLQCVGAASVTGGTIYVYGYGAS
jgi:hypothetical protein